MMGRNEPLLQKPVRYFTADDLYYGRLTKIAVESRMPVYWETDCLIFYVESGVGTLTVNQSDYALRQGCLCVLDSYHVFRFAALPGQPLELSLLVYPYPDITYLEFTQSTVSGMPASGAGLPVCVCLEGEPRARVKELLAEYRREQAVGDDASSMVKSCLLFYLRDIHDRESERSRSSAPEQSPGARALAYLSLNCRAGLTARSAAQALGMSVPRLNMELRRLCGLGFGQALGRARVCYAYSALFYEDVPMRTLAKLAGFTSENTFYRAFQEVFGVSPQKFREQKLLRSESGPLHMVSDKLVDIQLYVFHNWHLLVSCAMCARALFMTEASINQILQDRYGRDATFQRFLTEIRLRYSEGLLAVGDMPVYDVALESGFNSVHTLIRQMKKTRGTTPMQFRAGHREVPHV